MKKEKIKKEICCPLCKSAEKKFVSISIKDGPIVYGGRNSRTELANYFVCQNCGIMYVNLFPDLDN